MEKIIAERGTGKTAKLINLAVENNGIIVCSNPAHVINKGYDMGVTNLNVLSYVQYSIEKSSISQPVYIDDIDAFFAEFDSNIAGYSVSKD